MLMKTTLFKLAGGNTLFAALLLLLSTSVGFGQAATATWNLTSNENVATSGAITGTNLAIGSGINSPSYGGTNGVSTNSWSNDAGNAVGNEFYEYEITPSANNRLTVTSVTLNHSVSNGNWLGAVYYSYNGFATAGVQIGTNFVSASTSQTALNLTGLSLAVPVGGSFSIRVYGWESDGPNRSFRNRNVVISGTTCAMPVINTQPQTQAACAGSELNLSVAAANATSYQWKKGGVNIGGAIASTYTIPALAAADAGSYTVEVINSCHTVTSNAAVITVNPLLAASVSIGASATAICAGTNVTFTATPVNGGSASYQWKVNGSNVGTNSTTYSTTALTNGAVVTCVMSSTTPCRTGLPAISNGITMTVNPNLPASVSVSASNTTICQGTQVTFTATPTNGGTTPSYQWKVNGANAGSNSATFQSTALNNNDSVTCVMTSNASPCLTGSPATSAAVVMTVNSVPAAVAITPASAVTICENTIVPLSATGGLNATGTLLNENFNGALTFTTAGSNTGGGAAFTLRTSPYNASFAGTFESPDNSKFMMAHTTAFGTASTNSTLTSAAINTMGYSSLSLGFSHTYKKGTESGVNVQVSTNGGANWTNVKTYSTNQGAEDAFVSDNVNLNAYVNVANLRIRFNYVAATSSFNTAWWAIDGVTLSGASPSILWSPQTGLYTNAAATTAYTGQNLAVVYAKPFTSTTYTATSSSQFGCGTQASNIAIIVNPLPTFGSVAQDAVVCQDSNATMKLTGLLANSTSTVSYRIGGGPVQAVPGIVADAWGDASFQVNLSLANNGQILIVTNIERTDLAFTCNFVPSVNNTAALQVNANVSYYADADADGFGDPAVSQVSCFGAPLGYITNNTDCNDADENMNTSYAFYTDADLDGFGAGELTVVCAVDANTPPAGYSQNDTDCNDADNTVNATFDFFVDADEDGFGSATIQNVCATDANTPPAGYALNGTDCNDLDDTMNAEFAFYIDADADNYGTGSLINTCAVGANTPPAGYSLTNNDCDDLLAAVNPGQAEVLYNGIDDNCNGQLDEGFQLLSQVLASQCGTTLTTISSLIGCVSFSAPVTGYRFKVMNTATFVEQTIDRNVPHFQLSSLPAFDYATTYAVSIELQRNGVWLGYYGPSCLVSSPAILDTNGAAQVTPSQCGITLPSISSLIATTSLPSVTSYRFRVTNMTDVTAPNQVQTLDRSLHWFALTMLPTYTYGTTYLIEVAVKTNGVFSGFGSPCQVSTPAVPSLAECNAVIATPGTNISTASLNRVTSYRFEITDMTTFITTTIDRSLHWFNFHHVPGYTPSGPYSVRVAMMSSGVWSVLGEACMITAPGAARSAIKGEETQPQIDFRVVSYPNPYSESFALDVDLPTTEPVDVKVYDMLGKIVEKRTFEAIDAEIQQFGNGLSAGVYNVIVTQGEDLKTLRIVKR